MKNYLLTEVLDELKGEDGAQLLGSDGLSIKIKGVIPTGCPSIDAAIGRGGVPLGRLSILYGFESSGKTSLALHIASECQKMGGVVVYMDMEYKLDPEYAAKLGVDIDNVIIVQPPYLEKVFNKTENIINRALSFSKKGKKHPPILIVLDSMNAAITKAQLEGEYDDQPHYGPQAGVYSKSLPKLIPIASRSQTALLFISQIRKNIGIVFGNDDSICGGNAPKFYSSLNMCVTKLSTTKTKDGSKISNKIRVDCFKNQIAPPFKKAECEIVYGKGVDKERSLLWIAEERKLVVKSGSWLSYGKVKLGAGAANAAEMLRKNPEVKDKLMADLEKLYKWKKHRK